MSFILKLLFCLSLPVILSDLQGNKINMQESGKMLYDENCKLCHGSKGTRTFGGSKKITKSILTKEERIELISKGKGTMTGFENKLDSTQINLIAEYTMTLSKNDE